MHTRSRILTLLLVLWVVCGLYHQANTQARVKGYYKKDGTYVQPHYRSNPDGNFYNNWSTRGNINPYTGKPGTKVTPPAGNQSAAPSASIPSAEPQQDFSTDEALAPQTPAEKEISPSKINASSDMLEDQKNKDIERARYWKEKGYDFDPDEMPAILMDQKVKDIERARYWREKGYDFDPDEMPAILMDQKVKDIERARYWKEKGYDFDPDEMSSYQMDIIANTR